MPFSDRFHTNTLGIYSATWGNDSSSHTNLSNPYNPPTTYGQCVDPSLSNFFPRRNTLPVSNRDNYILGGFTDNVDLEVNYFGRSFRGDGIVNFTPKTATPGAEIALYKFNNVNLYSDVSILVATTIAISVTTWRFENMQLENTNFDFQGNANALTIIRSCIFNECSNFIIGREPGNPGVPLLFDNCVCINTRFTNVGRGLSRYYNSYFEGFELNISNYGSGSGSIIEIEGCIFNDNDLILDTRGQANTDISVRGCYFNNSEIEFNSTLYANLEEASNAVPEVFGVWNPSINGTDFGNFSLLPNLSFNNSSLLDFSLRYDSQLWRLGFNNENIGLTNLGYARVVNNSQGQGVSFSSNSNIGDGLTLVNSDNDYRQTGINNIISDNGFNIFSTSSPYELGNISLRGSQRLQYSINQNGVLQSGSNTIPHSNGDYRINIKCKFRCENVSDSTQFLIDYPYYVEVSEGIFETDFIKLGFETKPFYDVVNGVGSGDNLFGSRNIGGVDYYNPDPSDLIPIVGEQITTTIELNENSPSNTDIGFQGFTLIFKQNTIRELDVNAIGAVSETISNLVLKHPDETQNLDLIDEDSVDIVFGWGIGYIDTYTCDFDFSGIVDGVPQSFSRTNQPMTSIIII